MMRQDVDDYPTVFDPAPSGDLMPEHHLLTVVVHPITKDESGGTPRLVDRPTGEAARHLQHILLRVAAINAHRVQLHELTGVILVDAGLVFGRLRRGHLW